VTLASFEGPLDLLLHLIRKNKIDLAELPIIQITQDYNAALAQMNEYNLNIAADFLVMASTLVQLKARFLLPDPPVEGEEDPHQQLVRQLLAHQSLQQSTDFLHERATIRSKIFPRGAPLTLDGDAQESVVLELDLFSLLQAYRDVVNRQSIQKSLEFQRIKVRLLDRIKAVLFQLDQDKKIRLSDLLGRPRNRMVRIVSFLAVLELMRLQWITLTCEPQVNDWWVEARFDSLSAEEIKHIANQFGEESESPHDDGRDVEKGS
jgi:segregation and condensation protein A